MSTIHVIVIAVVVLAVAGAICKIVRDRGTKSCGCKGCSRCQQRPSSFDQEL